MNWSLDGWHGYQGADFEAVVDLGDVMPIEYIGAGFIQDIRSWIWMPKDVTFYVSDDGESFTKISHIKNTVHYDDYEIFQEDLGEAVNTSARYIKVKATNFGTIPDWHLGTGGDAYIFIDEIIVE